MTGIGLLQRADLLLLLLLLVMMMIERVHVCVGQCFRFDVRSPIGVGAHLTRVVVLDRLVE